MKENAETLIPMKEGTQNSLELFERNSTYEKGLANQNEMTRDKLTKLVLFSFTFMIVELVGGYLSNSIAVISDGFHMMTDFLGYSIQLLSAYLASKPKTSNYNFGLGRAESIAGLFNCFIIWGLTIELLIEAVKRLFNKPEFFQAGVMLFTAFLGVLLNLAMGSILVGFENISRIVVFWKDDDAAADSKEDFNIKSTIMHIRGDMIYSVGVLISAIIINIFPSLTFIDSFCTIIFSYVVLEITLPILKSASSYILESVPEGYINRLEL